MATSVVKLMVMCLLFQRRTPIEFVRLPSVSGLCRQTSGSEGDCDGDCQASGGAKRCRFNSISAPRNVICSWGANTRGSRYTNTPSSLPVLSRPTLAAEDVAGGVRVVAVPVVAMAVNILHVHLTADSRRGNKGWRQF